MYRLERLCNLQQHIPAINDAMGEGEFGCKFCTATDKKKGFVFNW